MHLVKIIGSVLSIFGDGLFQDASVVLMSAVMFGLAHFYQGMIGMITTGLPG